MSKFSEALQAALADLDWTQTRLGEEAGLPRDRVNKYATGAIDAGSDVVEQLCKALPAAQRAEVICAYLEDRIPESGKELIRVTSVFGRKAKSPKLPVLNEPAREALEGLARLVAHDPQLTLLLLQLHDALAKGR